jgi:MFS family permease
VVAAGMGAAIVGLAMMNPAELHRTEVVPRGPAQLREGLRYVRGHPEVLTLLVLVFCVSLFAINFYTVLPIVAANVFGRSADGYGMLFTLLAIGTLAGSLLAARRGSRGNPGPRFLIGAAVSFGVLEVVAGVMPTYLAYGLALIPVGVAMMTFMPTANSTVQLAVTPTMRGRVMGLYMLVFLGSNPLGAPLSGWVADVLGGRAPLILGGALTALSALVCGLMLLRRPISEPGAQSPDTATAPARATAT